MALEVAKSFDELIESGKTSEDNEDLDKAAKLYERAIKIEPLAELPYNRLMIIYRRQKKYAEELRVIEKGIEEFKEFQEKRANRVFGMDKKAMQLSKSLAKSLGVRDRKGKSLVYPEPIVKWLKRADTVRKKLTKPKKKS